jgi:hypothetical protein
MSTILLAVVALATTAAAEGQVRVVRYGADRLVGIRQVDVVMTIAAVPAGSCAPERAPLQSAAAVALRQAGLRATISEKAPSWFYSVIVDIASAGIGDSCATAISTQLVAQVEGIPEADRTAAPGTWGSLLVGEMPLLRVADLVTARAQEHDATVVAAVRAQVAAIAAKIRAANP